MADKTVSVNVGAIGSPAFLLFLVFLVLKLCDKIDWSWAWVTSPLWIPFALWAAIMFFALCMVGIASLLGK